MSASAALQPGHDGPTCITPLLSHEIDTERARLAALGVAEDGDLDLFVYNVALRTEMPRNRRRSVRVALDDDEGTAPPCASCIVVREAPDGLRPCDLADPMRLADLIKREANAQFVATNDGLFRGIARRIEVDGLALEDRAQIARTHGWKSLDTFDPTRRVNPRTWVAIAASRALFDEIDKAQTRRKFGLHAERAVQRVDTDHLDRVLGRAHIHALTPSLDTVARKHLRLGAEEIVDRHENGGNKAVANANGMSPRTIPGARQRARRDVLGRGLVAALRGDQDSPEEGTSLT